MTLTAPSPELGHLDYLPIKVGAQYSSIHEIQMFWIILLLDGNPVMCLGENGKDECYEYDVGPLLPLINKLH